ncbi:hypothetical protein Krac_11466 [Ktedonobacter racemifer DSM 44963]|uniref:Uncharacterized protein n=1 Tax=Ktedonobacter racemifer DSM 44963 TaxID=485913 RepID=D6TBU9_KTERA|nr:hypothetical protein Krac_11466 [Ktedonobacter racemifer DSM 44963]
MVYALWVSPRSVLRRFVVFSGESGEEVLSITGWTKALLLGEKATYNRVRRQMKRGKR